MNKNRLKKIIKKIFLNHGLANQHAEISSNYIIKAELVGVPSHGLIRLKMEIRISYKQPENLD